MAAIHAQTGDAGSSGFSGHIRPCHEDEAATILAIINRAAVAYRGAIPADCWHDPYMTMNDLRSEIAAGVSFAGYENGGELLGIMGSQTVGNVVLIRHAYVRPVCQGQGVGGALIGHLCRHGGQILVGTWADAAWAIRFYEKHGFELVEPGRDFLLRTYWSIPDRQAAVSVVLASPSLSGARAQRLVAAYRGPAFPGPGPNA